MRHYLFMYGLVRINLFRYRRLDLQAFIPIAIKTVDSFLEPKSPKEKPCKTFPAKTRVHRKRRVSMLLPVRLEICNLFGEQ